jgi:hypothetical protein
LFSRDALTNINQLQEYFKATKLGEAEVETHFDEQKLAPKKPSFFLSG